MYAMVHVRVPRLDDDRHAMPDHNLGTPGCARVHGVPGVEFPAHENSEDRFCFLAFTRNYVIRNYKDVRQLIDSGSVI